MKYTNIKKLLIKFMGGGLINFPTRFLRWIKIDGDAEGDDGGGGDDSGGDKNIRFVDALMYLNKESDERVALGIKNMVSMVSYTEDYETIEKESKPDKFLVFEYSDDTYSYSPSDDLIFALRNTEQFVDLPWGDTKSAYLPELDDYQSSYREKTQSVRVVSYDDLNIDYSKCLIYALYKVNDFLHTPNPNGKQIYTAVNNGQNYYFDSADFGSTVFVVNINDELYFGNFYGD